jgi:prophage endopeptidase
MGMTSSMAFAAALVLSMSTLGTAAWRAGASHSEQACHAERAQVAIASATELATRTTALRLAERELRDRLNTHATQHQQELDRLERSKSELAARLRAGTVRVSVPVAAESCVAAASTTASAGSEHQPAQAELAPEIALALDDIAADGDVAIIDLNRCIAAYDAVGRVIAQAQ